MMSCILFQNMYQHTSEKVDNEYTRKEIVQQASKPGLYQSIVCVTSIMNRNIRADHVLHTNQHDVWVYNGYTGLTLYDEHIIQRKTIIFTSNIYDMILTASQDIIATDNDTKYVVKISPTGNVSTLCSPARAICTMRDMYQRQAADSGRTERWFHDSSL